MTIQVVGGVYRERCIHPRRDGIFGSAGRAAIGIATLKAPVVLHSYMGAEAAHAISESSAWLNDLQVGRVAVSDIVEFTYLHDMAVPVIRGIPAVQHPPLEVAGGYVVRFGMLEGDAIVKADWAVYDPQNGSRSRSYRSNGSTANRLAIVLNAGEAAHLAGTPGEPPAKVAPMLAAREEAEVVVIKMGPEGAYVWTPSAVSTVPAFRTNRVWKIGSGDCFVAHFAYAWMKDGKTPAEAAEIASRATAYYCETQGLPTADNLASTGFTPIQVSDAYRRGERPQVYLAGPFFDLAQLWLVHQARDHLRSFGLRVFSPFHDVGLGAAEDVVAKDLEAIDGSDLLLALTDGLDAGTLYEIGYARAKGKPVVVYSERHKGESLKMMEGSGCEICTDYTTALYTTLWEAARI